jgi:hypothetical protein
MARLTGVSRRTDGSGGPRHLDERVHAAVRLMLERPHGLEPRPLVDADRALVERGDGEGEAAGSEALVGVCQARLYEPEAEAPASQVRPQPETDDNCIPLQLETEEADELPGFVECGEVLSAPALGA